MTKEKKLNTQQNLAHPRFVVSICQNKTPPKKNHAIPVKT